ncbi:MAG TPA: hypothetical protein VJW75_10895 [Candidatus Eisenbacteria bacterium]|nr:hypothetical protein [Candidatus Eisenbacteria bacterium]
MLRTLLLMLAVLCCSAATSLPEAEASLLFAGDRVRLSVTTPELIRVLSGDPLSADQSHRDQFIGTLRARRDDDVVIRVGSPATELAVPVNSVRRIEVSLGRHGRAGRGALIGLGAGALGGALAGLIVCSGGNCESSGITGETGLVTMVLGLGGAVVGTGVGALTGSLIRSERWRTVELHDLPYGEGLSPEGGLRLGLTLPIWSREPVPGTEGCECPERFSSH